MNDNKVFYIAGVQHHQMHKVLNDLEEGEILDLETEPDNKFDPNAVKIMYEDIMLGYVPKKFSAEVAAMIETGSEPICIINKLNKSAKPWEQCEVMISTEDPFEAEDPICPICNKAIEECSCEEDGNL